MDAAGKSAHGSGLSPAYAAILEQERQWQERTAELSSRSRETLTEYLMRDVTMPTMAPLRAFLRALSAEADHRHSTIDQREEVAKALAKDAADALVAERAGIQRARALIDDMAKRLADGEAMAVRN